MASCVVHYENYTGENDELLPLDEDKYNRLVSARASRLQLGGGYVHELQSSKIPELFTDSLSYHRKQEVYRCN